MVDATAVTYQNAGTGSVAETVYGALHRTCWAEDFGAVANGTHDDAASIQAAFNAGYQVVKLQSNVNYYVKSKITLPAFGIIACDGLGNLLQAYNGLILDMSASACGLRNIRLNGQASSYPSAGGILIAGNGYQFLDNGGVVGFGGYAIEFSGLESGAVFRANMADLQSLNMSASVKMPDPSGGAGENTGGREFIGCEGLGRPLINLAAAANTRIIGGATTGLIFSAYTTRTIVSSVRLATVGATLTIDGVANQVLGCEIAGPVTFAATSKGCTFDPSLIAVGYQITDLSAATGENLNDIYGQRLDLSNANVTWGQASGVGPSLGNGNISGRFTRTGRRVSIDLYVVPGSTTTYGDGTAPWTFALGSGVLPPAATARAPAIGSALAFDAGVRFETGVVQVPQGTSVSQVVSNGFGGAWNASTPHTWKNGDYFELSYQFELG